MLFLCFFLFEWLPTVEKYDPKISSGYAGKFGYPIDLVTVSGGTNYRVHYLGSPKNQWEIPVSGYNINNGKTGYAGTPGKKIDGFAIQGVKNYCAHIKGGNWLPEVHKYDITSDDGYAGIYGKEIDAIMISGRKYAVSYLPSSAGNTGKSKQTPSQVRSSNSKRISEKGLNIIKEFESLRLTAYRCPAGVLTIGYGHTSGVYAGQKITKQVAHKYLLDDVARFENAVNSRVKVPLSQNQFDALVSFTYNVGAGAFQKSDLLKYLNRGEYMKAANEFPLWVNGGGKRLPGLVRRRRIERNLFIS